MTISGVLLRFFLAYVVFMALAGVALNLLGIAGNSGVNVGILVGAIFWSCQSFGSKNSRYFTASEKTRVVWGMIAINLALQMLVAALALSGAKEFPLGALMLGLAVVGVLHSLLIFFFVGSVGKMLAKQQAKLKSKQGPMAG